MRGWLIAVECCICVTVAFNCEYPTHTPQSSASPRSFQHIFCCLFSRTIPSFHDNFSTASFSLPAACQFQPYAKFYNKSTRHCLGLQNSQPSIYHLPAPPPPPSPLPPPPPPPATTITMVKSEPSPVQSPNPISSSLTTINGGGGGLGGADQSQTQQSLQTSSTSTPSSATRTNAKDPSRPRRKKARRACFACQRAHLTCGNSTFVVSVSTHHPHPHPPQTY